MELLESTLKELEAREKGQQNLDAIYVKDLYPTFQQEFKNADIQDLENYSNYSLQNILDDLRHIQMLYDGSPTPKFKVKQEFLVQLSQGILRKMKEAVNKEADPAPVKAKPKPLQPYKEKAEKDRGLKIMTAGDGTEIQTPIIRKKVGPASPIKIRRSTTPIKGADKAVVVVEQPKQEQVSPVEEVGKEGDNIDTIKEDEENEKKKARKRGEVKQEEAEGKKEGNEGESDELREKEGSMKEIRIKKVDKDKRPTSQGKKRAKEDKKKVVVASDGQDIILSQINEAVLNEESENEDGVRGAGRKKWELTEQQEKQIKEMSIQYGVEVEALKNYIETKATNNQFNWIGIKRLDNKVVDVNLELSKLESEYERFVQRRQHFQSLQLMLPGDSFMSAKTLPYLSRHHTTTNALQKSRTVVSGKFHNSYVGPETTKGHNRSFGNSMNWSSEQRSMDNFTSTNAQESEDRTSIGSGNIRRRQAPAKSLALSRANVQQEYARQEGKNNLQNEHHWTGDINLVKSSSQFRLPSIGSLSPTKKAIPTQTTVNALSVELDEDENNLRRVENMHGPSSAGLYNRIASPNFKGSMAKRNTGSATRNARGFPILADHLVLNRLDSRISIEDSMGGDVESKDVSRIPSRQGGDRSKERKISATIMKKALSQISTTRSNHVISLNNVVKAGCADSVLMEDFITLKSTVSQTRTENELKGRDDAEYEVRRRESDEEGKMDKVESMLGSEHEEMGTTLQTLSTKSMTTVYTVENQSRYASLKSLGSGMRLADGEPEYCGSITKLHLLGGGSQAKVFLCKVKEFEDLVALKLYDIVKSQHYGGQSYDALKNEFHMLRTLDHSCVIKYFCLYRSRKKTYTNGLEFGVIMEYMPGGSLESYIEGDFDSISFRKKKNLIKQILQGLEFLHQNHIIHRDLKPENILLSDDKSQAKISDFGISTQSNNDINAPRSMVGTPWYMAPEIINEEPYSSKADIWSAGCCFMHLLTGKKPYHMANAVQAMLLMTNYKSPLESCEEETLRILESYKGLKELLLGCFSRDKNKRPSATQLLRSPFFNDD